MIERASRRPMKAWLYKSAVLILLLAILGSIIWFGWPQYLAHVEATALKIVGQRAREITAVEILRLTDSGENGPAGSYLIGYDNSKRGIAWSKALLGEGAATVVRLWKELGYTNQYQAGCHEPGFV